MTMTAMLIAATRKMRARIRRRRTKLSTTLKNPPDAAPSDEGFVASEISVI